MGSLAKLLVLVFLTSCAAAPPGMGMRANSSVLLADEIRATTSTNLLDVVERLRPLWLRTGPQRSANLPTEVVVVVNDMYFGGLDSLQTISPDNVVRLRYLDAAAATAQVSGLDSSRQVAGAILVEFTSR